MNKSIRNITNVHIIVSCLFRQHVRNLSIIIAKRLVRGQIDHDHLYLMATGNS